MTCRLAGALKKHDWAVHPGPFFDTIRVWLAGDRADHLLERASAHGVNLRKLDDHAISLTLDETTQDLSSLLPVFDLEPAALAFDPIEVIGSGLRRESDFLRHPVFNRYHTETELCATSGASESRDLSLTASMIPLGSCTMKLNATSEMLPVTWPEFASIHPFAPADQTQGYQMLFAQLEKWLAEITGFAAISLQPNAGSQGEYAGLLVIRRYHGAAAKRIATSVSFPVRARHQSGQRRHGGHESGRRCTATNGDIDRRTILRAKADRAQDDLAAFMVTYPSTHGVFEEGISEICANHS